MRGNRQRGQAKAEPISLARMVRASNMDTRREPAQDRGRCGQYFDQGESIAGPVSVFEHQS
jgi:hypothetical protein